MLIMALDHVRDLIHTESLTGNPTDLSSTTAVLFLTRWITHLCAPTFVFLSGASAYLALRKESNLKASRLFLVNRGIWLLVLEFTIINFGIWFDVHVNVLLFQVIAAIGMGFIALGSLLSCSAKTLGILGILIITLHNLFPLLPLADDSLLKTVLSPLFAPTLIPFGHSSSLLIGYPPVPWIAILFTGFWCGRLFTFDQRKRKHLFLIIGSFCILLFAIIRYSNIYGDPLAWTNQKNTFFTLLSFINVTKYPPSLLFDLLMLGLMFLLLWLAEGKEKRLTNVISVYGQVPLFYYLLHWYIIHSALFIILFAQGFSFSDFVFGFNFGRPKETSGLDLWGIYLLWLGLIIVLYPLCRWYGGYKLRNRVNKWLKYL